MDTNVDALIAALAQTRELLCKHGDRHVSGRLYDLEGALARSDWSAIQSAITEATGSMGSLRDRWLSASNGDAITGEEEPEANARLDSLVLEVERSARKAAEGLGLRVIG